MESTFYKRDVTDEIIRYLNTDDIIVIHGARQVGKTSILMYLQRQLRSQGKQTLYIDLEDSRFVALLDRGVEEFLNYLHGEGFDLVRMPGRHKSSLCLLMKFNILPHRLLF